MTVSTMAESDGFLGRWSRRKQEVREGKPVEAAPAVPVPDPVAAANPAPAPVEVHEPEPAGGKEKAPPPTLEDVRALTPESDFSRFVGAEVAPEVRHVAMRKLFSDPHFNVMDGLDVYIDDYNKPDPLPLARLRQLASAKVLGLVQAPPETADKAAETAETAEETQAYADPDLRLQQDHAAGPQDAGDGARGNTDAA